MPRSDPRTTATIRAPVQVDLGGGAGAGRAGAGGMRTSVMVMDAPCGCVLTSGGGRADLGVLGGDLGAVLRVDRQRPRDGERRVERAARSARHARHPLVVERVEVL